MKRLLRIGFSNFILSIIPIVSWFLLGIIISPSLINIFSITYPLQFISGLIMSIFAVGANISEYKDKKEGTILSGLTIGFIVAVVCILINVFCVEQYLTFMNVDVQTYKLFAIYDIVSIFIRMVFSFVLEKLYFEEKDKKAFVYTIIYNILNFVCLIGISLICKNQVLIVAITLAVVGIYTVILFGMQFKKFKFRFGFLQNMKYECQNIFTYILLFITYLFGFSSSFVFGENYIIALNFVALVTDSQWDACEAMTTVAKIDIVNKRYDYKKITKQSYLFVTLLVLSSLALFFVLFGLYNVDLRLGLMYLSFEVITLLIAPTSYYFEPLVQIEYSPLKNTILTLISQGLRSVCAVFIPLAICTQIGQVVANIFMVVTLFILKKLHFAKDENGFLIRSGKGEGEAVSTLQQ